MVGHDQVGVGREAQARGVNPAASKPVKLLSQNSWVDDNPVADRAGLSRVEDPGRHEVELEDLTIANDRVPGVVAALKAHDHLDLLREQVGDLAFAFVAPLGAHDCYAGHDRGSMPGAPRKWTVS